MSIARVAIFEGINVEAARASMDEAEAIIAPMVAALPGYEGMTQLASYDGKFISITIFDTPENATAAESTFDQDLPAALGHIFQEWAGTRTSVGQYVVVGEDRS
jgi:hypothetical protein